MLHNKKPTYTLTNKSKSGWKNSEFTSENSGAYFLEILVTTDYFCFYMCFEKLFLSNQTGDLLSQPQL